MASPAPSPPLDLLAFGEALVRLGPPHGRRLEAAPAFEVEVGGSEANVAVAVARLGGRAAWLSRLGDDPLGRRVERAIAAQGVDTSSVVWCADRNGLCFVELADPPRPGRVLYDRAGSAASRMAPADLPPRLLERLRPRVLHTSGVALALSEAARTTAAALGVPLSLDVNFRARLWGEAEAALRLAPFMERAAFVFCSRRDAPLFGAGGLEPEATLAALRPLCPAAVLALTLGEEGALVAAPGGEPVREPALPTVGRERVGSGDAFAGAFLLRFLETGDPAEAARWGNAAAALKRTVPGDFALVDRGEVAALAAARGEPRPAGPVVDR